MLSTYCLVFTFALGALAQCNQPLTVPPTSCCNIMPSSWTPDTVASCQIQPAQPDQPPPCQNMICMLQKINLLNGENRVDRFNAMNNLKALYSPDWDSAITMTVTKCFQQMDSTPSDCEARQFAGCFTHNLLINCPYNLWTQTSDCEAAKNFLINCVPPMV